MSIAPHSGARRRPNVRPAGAAASRLDRALAPLADLGDAIRDEIAVSIAPLAQELETALERMSTLELQAHDLEARLADAAAALLGLPIPAARPGVEKPEMPRAERTDAVAAEIKDSGPNRAKRAATAERLGTSGPTKATADLCTGMAPPSASPAGAAAGVRPRMMKPRRGAMAKHAAIAPGRAMSATPVPAAEPAKAEAAATAAPSRLIDATAPAGACAAAATVPAAQALDTPEPSASESSGTAGAAVEPAEVVSVPSGPFYPAVKPGSDTHEAEQSGAPATMSGEPAAGNLHPLLEQGAREMIALGHYPDLSALLNEAVYRLLASDYPAGPGGASPASLKVVMDALSRSSGFRSAAARAGHAGQIDFGAPPPGQCLS